MESFNQFQDKQKLYHHRLLKLIDKLMNDNKDYYRKVKKSNYVPALVGIIEGAGYLVQMQSFGYE